MKSKLSCALLFAIAVSLNTLSAYAAAGAVYTLNNSSSGNAVLVFSRSADGEISSVGTFSTGGTGTGKGLGNQGALAIDAGDRFLFAVNAGSDNISVFRITENGLHLVDLAPSGGNRPISTMAARWVAMIRSRVLAWGKTATSGQLLLGFP